MKAEQETITDDADETSHDATEHCQNPQQTTTALLDNSHPFAKLFPLIEGPEYAGLVEDIRANGLREPIVVDGRGRILDGRNRLRACLEAGIEYTKSTFLGDNDAILRFVISKNLHRRHLDESQRAMVAARLATLKDGQRKSASPIGEATSQADAAELLNVGKRSIERARVVLDNAVPELVELVDGGKLAVSAAADVAKLPDEKQDELVARGEVEILAKAKEIRAQRQGEKRIARRAMAETKAANAGPLPADRTFCVIYADPPWTFETYSDLGKDRSAENHYPTMTLQQICDLPVPRCAAEDAVLFLWATSPNLEQAFEVIKYWGFSYKSSLVWVKNRLATGFWTRNRHEFLLIATRGDIPAPDPASIPDSVIEAPIGEHSVKPAVVRSIIEQMTPGLSRVELFARGKAPEGWQFWGFDSVAA